MQRSRILSLREKFKDNILYQAGYSEEFTLEKILGINESEALNTLPKWILINRMSQEQLELLLDKLEIDVPESCPKSRQALAKFTLSIYAKWDKVLNNDSISVKTLRNIFKQKCGASSDLAVMKREIQKCIKLIDPGDEILYMWITSNAHSFSPALFRIPGPTIHKNRINT